MSYFDDYERERSYELDHRLERDAEKEPRDSIRPAARRKQFRYWSGAMFRPARVDFSAPEIASPIESARVDARAKRGGRYEPAETSTGCQILPSRVDAHAKRAVHNWPILDEKDRSRSVVGVSHGCAILRREA